MTVMNEMEMIIVADVMKMLSVYWRYVLALWKRNAQLRMLLKPYRNDALNIFPLRSFWLIPMELNASRIVWKIFIFLDFRFGFPIKYFSSHTQHTLTGATRALTHTHTPWAYTAQAVDMNVSASVGSHGQQRLGWHTNNCTLFFRTIHLSRRMDTVSRISKNRRIYFRMKLKLENCSEYSTSTVQSIKSIRNNIASIVWIAVVDIVAVVKLENESRSCFSFSSHYIFASIDDVSK